MCMQVKFFIPSHASASQLQMHIVVQLSGPTEHPRQATYGMSRSWRHLWLIVAMLTVLKAFVKSSIRAATHDVSSFDIIKAQGLSGVLESVILMRSVLFDSHVSNPMRLHTTLRFARPLVSHARPLEFARITLASTGGGFSCTASALLGENKLPWINCSDSRLLVNRTF